MCGLMGHWRRWVLALLVVSAGVGPALTVAADQAVVGDFDAAPTMVQPGDEADLFLYNVFLTGDHSADSADAEGGMAIQGDSKIPAIGVNHSAGHFNYGAMFGTVTNGVGQELNPRNKLSLLIGGQIHSYSGKLSAQVIGTPGDPGKLGVRGWLATAATAPYWFNQPQVETQAGVKLMTPARLTRTFAQLTQQEQAMTARLDVDVAATSDTGAVSAGDLTLRPSQADPHVYVVSVNPPAGSDTVAMPQVGEMDALIDDPQTKEIIFTTTAAKVVFDQTAMYHGRVLDINDKNGPATKVASRVLFYLPNATQVTNYTGANHAAPDIRASAAGPVGKNGEDLYDKAYFDQYTKAATAVAGSMVVPQATIVWNSGNINGYVFAHALHQRGGAETHNFYNPWLAATDLTIHKIWADDANRDGVRPTTLTFNVFSDQQSDPVRVIQVAADQSAKEQAVKVTGLPKFTSASQLIHYRAEEVLPVNSGYTAVAGADGLTITNTHQPAQTEYQVKKRWRDYGPDHRPSEVAVQLYRGDSAHLEAVGAPVTLKVENQWQYTWTGLPKFHDRGQASRYFAREVRPGAGYTVASDDTQPGLTTLTNTYRPTDWHLRLRKEAVGTHATLPGATFRLGQALAGGQVAAKGSQTATTDQSGQLTFVAPLTFRPNTTYYLQEIQAPAGYQLDRKVTKLVVTSADWAGSGHATEGGDGTVAYTVTVDGHALPLDQTDTLTLTRKNQSQPVLPHTGGPGFGQWRQLAAWCLGLATLLGLVTWVRRRVVTSHD